MHNWQWAVQIQLMPPPLPGFRRIVKMAAHPMRWSMGTPKGKDASSCAASVNFAWKAGMSISPLTNGCSLPFSRRASTDLLSCSTELRV